MTVSLSPGVQPGGSNLQSARYLQHFAWPGRLTFAIRSLFTTLCVAREVQLRNPLAIYSTWRRPGGSTSQSARYLQHLAWPGRLKFAIRSLFTALGVAKSSYNTRITTYSESPGVMMQGGWAVRAPGLGIGGSYLATRDT